MLGRLGGTTASSLCRSMGRTAAVVWSSCARCIGLPYVSEPDEACSAGAVLLTPCTTQCCALAASCGNAHSSAVQDDLHLATRCQDERTSCTDAGLGAGDGVAQEVADAAVVLVGVQVHADTVAAGLAVCAHVPACPAAASMPACYCRMSLYLLTEGIRALLHKPALQAQGRPASLHGTPAAIAAHTCVYPSCCAAHEDMCSALRSHADLAAQRRLLPSQTTRHPSHAKKPTGCASVFMEQAGEILPA